MLSRRHLTILGSLCLTASLALSAWGGGELTPGIGAENVNAFLSQNPESRVWYDGAGRPVMLYGKSFAHGETPERTAENFFRQYRGVFGNVGQFTPAPRHADPGIVEGVMWNRDTQEFKFSLINYQQELGGVPVFRGTMQLLMRNDPGFPLVKAGGDPRDLTGLNMPMDVNDDGIGGALPKSRVLPKMIRKAQRQIGGVGEQQGDGRLVIWAGIDDMVVEPRLAIEFILETDILQPNYQKVLFLADAETGEILFQESQVYHADVVGNVSGNATDGIGADICHDEVPMGLPYARVRINGGNTSFTDVNGDFVIPHGGNSQVTVVSEIAGTWFRVLDQAAGGATPELQLNVTPPGPANFLHNAANTSETVRANVNCYLHANVVRDTVLFYVPNFPTIETQQNFTVNTNIANNCNAFYNGSSINFYTSGGGCTNTGASTVVYHEYGHHLVATGSSGGQGAYGEGMSDTVSVVITDDSRLAPAFQGNCSVSLRNADNTVQYPCSGPIHDCGRLLSGCVWSTRNELIVTEPADYLEILRQLTFESIRLHNYSPIDPRITIDFLTLDDDDDNLSNGTPHYAEIDAGFSAHNMDAPPLQPISFEFPSGMPELINPAGGTTMLVRVVAVADDPQPDTGILHVNTGGGFQEIPMNEVSSNLYEATFPASDCGSEVRYFVSAESQGGIEVTAPLDAPTVTFSAISGTGQSVAFEDDFETDNGWTVQNINLQDGQWERGIPSNNNRQDPPADFDGSGRCFVTDNAPGNSDVDGGPTILISPIIDVSDGAEYQVSYATWFGNSSNGQRDQMTVEVSSNGGSSWTLVETFTNGGSNIVWQEGGFLVSDFVPLTSQLRVRFVTADQPNDSVVEAGVDAFRVAANECGGETATLSSIATVFGTELGGGLAEVAASDDQYYRTNSAFGFQSSQPNLTDIVISGNVANETPTQVTLTAELRLNNPDGSMRMRLRNWLDSGSFLTVHQYPIGTAETIETVNVPNQGRFVQGGTGRIDLSLRHFVVATFSTNGFVTRLDWVAIEVE
ncbi:MAG: hypothetical protein ACR2GY_03625 [Phycisphaerales bacterium]